MGERLRRGAAVVIALFAAGSMVGRAQLNVQHRNGQSVVPVFDGYEPNDDGTVTLWFGYMNRNYEETPDIPIGPNNTFGGSKPDRGQPTHFQTRRKKAVFGVTVPESEAASVKWSVTTRGRTEVATPTILPSSLISRRRGTLNSLHGVPPNTPPAVQVRVDKQSVTISDSATAHLSATDDGQPKRSMTGGAMRHALTLSWSKYRGPGSVTFEPPTTKVSEGSVSTRMAFDKPGEYMLMATVDDGSMNFGEYCCWTNTLIKVTVR